MKPVRYLTIFALFAFSNSLFASCNSLLDFEAQKLRSSDRIDFCSTSQPKFTTHKA